MKNRCISVLYKYKYCSGLTILKIGFSVTEIGESAFYDCYGLETIYCNVVNPISISENVFEGVDKNKCALIVPTASNGAYTEAPVWKEFTKLVTGVSVIDAENADMPVDVYSLQGALLRKQVLRSEATEGLYPSIYIVGGKKVIVK